MMTVSLVITTYNWPEALRLVLLSAFKQKVKPDEIVIADDGSTDVTKELIDGLRGRTDIKIRHVWHEDEGFRRTVILNKAIAQASGDYIIQLDGDMVIHPCFIKDHLKMAELGYFVTGGRVNLKEKKTQTMLRKVVLKPGLTGITLGYLFNSLRINLLQSRLQNYYKDHTRGIRGSNLAFWKENFIQINGYNEEMTGWGYEDNELAFRLSHLGIKRKCLKMGGIGYHLWHPLSPKHKAHYNCEIMEQTIALKKIYTENGIAKSSSGYNRK